MSPSSASYVVPRSWNPAQTANTTAPAARAVSIVARESRIPAAAMTCVSSSPPPNR